MHKTVDKSLLILSAFSVDHPSLAFDDVAKRVGMPASTLYRFLHGLLRAGYVVKDAASQTYTLGPAVLRLGRVAEIALDLRALAMPWMDRLWERTGETIYLSVRLGLQRLCLESRERKGGGVILSIRPGETSPLYAGASGKVLLAFQPVDEIDAILREIRLVRVTTRTVTKRAELRRELTAIRERGWAYTEAEYARGSWGLAAPILNANGVASASLTVAGILASDGRTPPLRALTPLLVEATTELSRRLGAAE
jgi:IclR family KDG regulon transcriptional repressor